MNIFSTESMYDAKNGEWIETYYMNGEEISFEQYCDEQEQEAIKTVDEEDCNCECIDCITERYIGILQETSCPECISEILYDYLGEVLNRIEFDKEE